jgi:hypothetical protein
MASINVLEVRYSMTGPDGPWCEPDTKGQAHAPESDWSEPFEFAGTWSQSRVVPYSRVESHAGSERPTKSGDYLACYGGAWTIRRWSKKLKWGRHTDDDGAVWPVRDPDCWQELPEAPK